MKLTGLPGSSHAGISCTGENYEDVVKLILAKAAASPEYRRASSTPSLEGIQACHGSPEGDKIHEAALKALIRAVVALNIFRGRYRPPRPLRSKVRLMPAYAP